MEVILSDDTTYDRLIELLGQGGYHISAIQPLENTLQGLESSIKEDNTVSQGTADKDSKGISWKKVVRSQVMRAKL